jgi:hypothetical protein
MADTIQIRFRHTGGDIGPTAYSDNLTIQQLKDSLYSAWPKEGLLAKEPPVSPYDIKLILSGKYVESYKMLRDYRKEMGDMKPDSVVTMHLVVRPSNTPKQQTSAGSTEKEAKMACGCVIC